MNTKITHAVRVTISRDDLREVVTRPLPGYVIANINRDMQDHAYTLEAGLRGWGRYTHTLVIHPDDSGDELPDAMIGAFHVCIKENGR